MRKRTGRPKKQEADKKGRYLQVRVDNAEMAAFNEAAELAGLEKSGWVRERLRTAARKELQQAGRQIPFISGPSPKGKIGS
jgi:hypothetical protein